MRDDKLYDGLEYVMGTMGDSFKFDGDNCFGLGLDSERNIVCARETDPSWYSNEPLSD